MRFPEYAKALVAAAVTAGTALVAALDDNTVTMAEWITVAVAALSALSLTYVVPNGPSEPPEA